jgi:hypothetical protein
MTDVERSYLLGDIDVTIRSRKTMISALDKVDSEFRRLDKTRSSILRWKRDL